MAEQHTHDIYLITCKVNNRKYVGAASKLSTNGKRWGTIGRWKSHIKSSFKVEDRAYNYEIHKAIREHGIESFEVQTICETSDPDTQEQYYIKHYNSLHPNGYNLTEGGKNGKHCEMINEKKRVERGEFSEESRQNMSEGQLGKRYTHEIDRKNAEDKELPKYISSIRRNNELLGYQVKKFPIGTDKKEYIYKTFKNKANPTAALQKAIEHLEQLKIQYAEKLEVKEDEKESKSKATAMNLPKFVYPTDDEKYFVKGLKDYGKVDIPRFDFENVDTAVAFIQEVAKYNDAKKLPFRWSLIMLSEDEKKSKVLEFIEKTTYAGIHNGYAVKFVEKYDEKDKPVKIVKTFVGPSPMEEKLAQATTYIQDIAISMSI
jgi:hypothetical protein